MPELINMKKADPYKEYFKKIGTTEFFHSFAEGGAAIGLRIPISKVNGDIDSAIAKAKKAGFDASVDAAHSYLEIAKYGYPKEDDQKVVEELKTVAKDAVSKDYADHIEKLQLPLTQSMSKTPISTLESPISEIKKFNIPLISNEKELPLKKLILFASKHNNTKEGEHLENILNRLLEDGKKVIVLFETISDPPLKELLNNPKTDEETIKKYYIPMFGFPEAAGNVVFALRRVLHKYGTDRFEIVPIDVTSKEMADRLNGLISEDEYEKKRYENIVKNVISRYAEKRDSDNTVLLAFTGADHVQEICEALMKKEETDNVCVYMAPESL